MTFLGIGSECIREKMKRIKKSKRTKRGKLQEVIREYTSLHGMLVSMIAVKRLSKSYGEMKVLSDLSFHVDPKECLCIQGGSGSGKSLLMRLLLKEEHPDEGTVEVDGVDLQSLPAPVLQLFRRRIGPVFDESRLLPYLSVAENLALPLEFRGIDEATSASLVAEFLRRFGFAAKAKHLPGSLSRGERSMLSLLRGCIGQPMIIIADDPFSSLDDIQSEMAARLLKDLHLAGATIILLARDASIARVLGARVIHLKDGKIAAAPKRARAETTKEAPQHIAEEQIIAKEEVVREAKPKHKEPKEHAEHAHAPAHHPPQRKIKITAISGGE